LYYENHDRFKEYGSTISGTWLMGNNTVLKAAFRIGDLKLWIENVYFWRRMVMRKRRKT
jgi:hypothetical protein